MNCVYPGSWIRISEETHLVVDKSRHGQLINSCQPASESTLQQNVSVSRISEGKPEHKGVRHLLKTLTEQDISSLMMKRAL